MFAKEKTRILFRPVIYFDLNNVVLLGTSDV